MPIIYAAPSPVTVITETNLWLDTPMTWLGADGSLWNLTDGSQGVALKKGVRGLLMPSFARYSSSSPAVPGSRHKGSKAGDREVSWPVKVFTRDGSVAWRDLNRKFWRSFDPDIEGTWTVHHDGGATRSLRCRFLEVDDVLDRNPIKLGWHTYVLTLLADNPFWTGDPVTYSWKKAEQRNYYVSEADRITYNDPPGTINYLSSGTDLGTATFTNDGDEPAYPVWQGVGPFTSLTLGVEGSTLTIPFEVPAGKAVEIDTHPVTGQRLWFGDWDATGRIVVNRENRTTELTGDQRFAPIPAGKARELSLVMVGEGIVIATITPQYRSGL